LAGFDFQQDDFWQYSVPTLRSKLRDAGITGFSKTNKPELVAHNFASTITDIERHTRETKNSLTNP
jgi:hypothetical protein